MPQEPSEFELDVAAFTEINDYVINRDVFFKPSNFMLDLPVEKLKYLKTFPTVGGEYGRRFVINQLGMPNQLRKFAQAIYVHWQNDIGPSRTSRNEKSDQTMLVSTRRIYSTMMDSADDFNQRQKLFGEIYKNNIANLEFRFLTYAQAHKPTFWQRSSMADFNNYGYGSRAKKLETIMDEVVNKLLEFDEKIYDILEIYLNGLKEEWLKHYLGVATLE